MISSKYALKQGLASLHGVARQDKAMLWRNGAGIPPKAE